MLDAGPPSPENPATPVPATVVMVPFRTMRMQLLLESAIYTAPDDATATPCGKFSVALVAGPPSPENPARPVPAKVVIYFSSGSASST